MMKHSDELYTLKKIMKCDYANPPEDEYYDDRSFTEEVFNGENSTFADISSNVTDYQVTDDEITDQTVTDGGVEYTTNPTDNPEEMYEEELKTLEVACESFPVGGQGALMLRNFSDGTKFCIKSVKLPFTMDFFQASMFCEAFFCNVLSEVDLTAIDVEKKVLNTTNPCVKKFGDTIIEGVTVFKSEGVSCLFDLALSVAQNYSQVLDYCHSLDCSLLSMSDVTSLRNQIIFSKYFGSHFVKKTLNFRFLLKPRMVPKYNYDCVALRYSQLDGHPQRTSGQRVIKIVNTTTTTDRDSGMKMMIAIGVGVVLLLCALAFCAWYFRDYIQFSKQKEPMNPKQNTLPFDYILSS
uniref:ZP domain-containing protein n=1 Tax=Syphacia muris TaxID=451379 RepID=A0A0N5AKK4_9BILA